MESAANKTWTIDAGHSTAAQEIFAKLTKRANKLGVTPPSFSISDPRKVKQGKHTKVVVDVSTDIPVVRLSGWRFVAKLDASETKTPIVKTAPGQSLTDSERERAANAGHECDHCKVNRARNVTYVVAHEDGERAQVGSTCIDDFLGHSAGKELSMLDAVGGFIGEMDELSSGRGVASWDLIEVLIATVAVIDAFGWSPRSRGGHTADSVLSFVDPTPAGAGDAQRFWEGVTEEQKAKASACQAWLSNITPDNDYLHNLKSVAECGYVTHRLMGIACSAVAAYDRAMEREVKLKQEKESAATSKHLGEVKKRQSFGKVTVESLRYIEGVYGTTTLVKMLDVDGNVLTWFASNAPTLEVGESFELTATVKKHDEFKGVMQTVVTRAKMVPVADAA